MKQFTSKEYIDVSIANAMGMDKLSFEERIDWVANTPDILTKIEDAEDPYQLIAAMQAKEDADNGVPTGYIMGLDACSSGIQIMSLFTGDIKAASLCGLVNTSERVDVYQTCLDDMVQVLGPIPFDRSDIKECGMKVMYGSKAEPTKVLQDPTIITEFYESLENNMPKCIDLLFTLLDCADPSATYYEWTLPDGHVAHVPVMQTNTYEIKVESLDNYPVTHRISENQAKARDVSLPAHVIQSTDAYIVRELGLRCNYDYIKVCRALDILVNSTSFVFEPDHWTGAPSITRLYDLTKSNAHGYCDEEVVALTELARTILNYDSFEQVSVHDKFFASPIHMNRVRKVVSDIYAELSESTLLDSILTEIKGEPTIYPKTITNLPELIRNSNYIIS